VLIEVVRERDVSAALTAADAIDERLSAGGASAPRLLHGYGATAWPVLDAAIRRGHGIRIGLEDTLHLPDGSLARDNAELVTTARERASRSA